MSKKQIVIEFQNVYKFYGKKQALENFHLEIYKHDFITMIGSSGCGKTTALKMVNGLVTADSGKVLVHQKEIAKTDLIQLRRNIGYALQGSGLFPHMNVYQNIAYVPNLLNRKNKAKTQEAVQRLVELMRLDSEMLNSYPQELSGGQQQRVGIARALAANPDILLMDEPLGALDGITRQILQEEISRIHRELKVTILFVTHDIHEALKLGTKILVMDSGKILQFDTPNRIKRYPANDFVASLMASAS